MIKFQFLDHLLRGYLKGLSQGNQHEDAHHAEKSKKIAQTKIQILEQTIDHGYADDRKDIE